MPKQEPFLIKEHISIEEAKERGLTEIVKQLEMNDRVRISLGLKTHQEAISTNHLKDTKVGRPRKDSISSRPTDKKMIRVNRNNLV